MDISENYKRVKAEVEKEAAGREVLLLPVSKFKTVEEMEQAFCAGARCFGENYVQELIAKKEYFGDRAEFHFIGHLQKNKVKYIVDKVSLIHSVDSEALADEIEKQCAKRQIRLDVLIEVNIGGELSKSGVAPERLMELAEYITQLPHLRLSGLMVIPPVENGSSYFKSVYQLFIDMKNKKLDNTDIRFLSMGMSGDYPEAIRCGANIVRVGTAIFGSRKVK